MTDETAQRELWPIPEFCRAFGVSKTTAYDLLSKGTLTALRVGRRSLLTAESVERWRASLRRWQPGEIVVGASRQAAA